MFRILSRISSNRNIIIDSHLFYCISSFVFQFEAIYIDGPHHLHMTHVDEVAAHIEEYFAKYLPDSVKLNSQL